MIASSRRPAAPATVRMVARIAATNPPHCPAGTMGVAVPEMLAGWR